MLYIGNNPMVGYYAKTIAKEINEFYDSIPVKEDTPYLSDYYRELVAAKADKYVIDISSFHDDERGLIQAVSRLKEATNAAITIYAGGYSSDSSMANSFRAIGIGRLTFQNRNMTALQNEMRAFLSGDAEEVPEDLQQQIISSRENVIYAILEDNKNPRPNDTTAHKKTADSANLRLEEETAVSKEPEIFMEDEDMMFVENESEPPEDIDDGSGLGSLLDGFSLGSVKPLFSGQQSQIKNNPPELDSASAEEEKESGNPAEEVFPDIPGKNAEISKHHRIIKIGVVGAMPRIGTTTMAIQLCKFLNVKEGEHTACYMQHNDTSYLSAVDAVMEVSSRNDAIGCRTYAGVDMYCDPRKIRSILSQGYEYIVYDYGDMEICDEASLLEKDLILLVCGTDADELMKTEVAMRVLQQKNIFFMFNLCTEADFLEVSQAMKDRKGRCFRAGFIPDRFIYDIGLESAFLEMINSEELVIKDETKGVHKKRKRVLGTRR